MRRKEKVLNPNNQWIPMTNSIASEQSPSVGMENAEVRTAVYSLLGTLHLENPGLETLRVLESNRVSTLFESTYCDLSDDVREGIVNLEGLASQVSETDITVLSVEFTRLFRGISRRCGPPPPYESVYRGEGNVMGEATSEVRRQYQKAGLKLADEYAGDPPDHVAFELRFMSLLCENEVAAWTGSDVDRAMELVSEEKEFLYGHIATWVPDFCDQIIEEARVDFYKVLAKLSKDFISHECDLIERLLETRGYGPVQTGLESRSD